MPRITIHIGTRERLEPAILKATPMGALSTEALVHVRPGLELRGHPAALRALAAACDAAALLAEQHDADPAGYDEREQAAADAGEEG
jgi:hypothetical protein